MRWQRLGGNARANAKECNKYEALAKLEQARLVAAKAEAQRRGLELPIKEKKQKGRKHQGAPKDNTPVPSIAPILPNATTPAKKPRKVARAQQLGPPPSRFWCSKVKAAIGEKQVHKGLPPASMCVFSRHGSHGQRLLEG